MINNFSLINIYEKPKLNSKISSQMLYGEKFKILIKKKNWIKIKTNYDKYTGYIKNNKFLLDFNPTHKISVLKSIIYKKIKSKFLPTNQFLYFSSTIKNLEKSKKFIRFEKNKWINKMDLKNINHFETNYLKTIKMFLNIKYLWGGKSAAGIDCSALIQIIFKYNQKYFPRDTKDQIKFCKKINFKKFKSGDILFWKGHVGLCLNNQKFIHAYGPRKKVLIMPIKRTIDLIEKTAKLELKKISNIRSN